MKKIVLLLCSLSTTALAGGIDCNGKVFVDPNLKDKYPHDYSQRDAYNHWSPLPYHFAGAKDHPNAANIYAWYALDDLNVSPAGEKAGAEYVLKVTNNQREDVKNYDKIISGYNDTVTATLESKKTGEKFVATFSDKNHAISSSDASYPALQPLVTKAVRKLLARECNLPLHAKPESKYRCESGYKSPGYAGAQTLLEDLSVTRKNGAYELNYEGKGGPRPGIASCKRVSPFWDPFGKFSSYRCNGNFDPALGVYTGRSGQYKNQFEYYFTVNDSGDVVSIGDQYVQSTASCFRDLPALRAKSKPGINSAPDYAQPKDDGQPENTDAN